MLANSNECFRRNVQYEPLFSWDTKFQKHTYICMHVREFIFPLTFLDLLAHLYWSKQSKI